MRQMKDSGIPWVGQIPLNWDVAPLWHSLRRRTEDNHPNETVLSLYRDWGIVPKDSREDNHNVTSLDTSNYKFVRKGDFVINKMKAWQGSMAVSSYQGIVSPAYHVCEFISDKIFPAYLHYLLRDTSYLPEYDRLSTGLRIGQWDLSYDDFKNIPHVIPPLSEQYRIVSFLNKTCSNIDNIIEKTKSSIDEYKKLKHSVITEVTTKGIRGERPMKASGIEWIERIPKEWGIGLLSQNARQVKNKNTGFKETNLLSLSYGKIIKKSINTSFGLLPENFDGYNIIEPENIVLRLTDLQNDQKSLRVGITKQRGIITSAYITLEITSDIVADYLYYQLHSFDIVKGFYGMGAGIRQGLNWNELSALKIFWPDIKEQKEIVSYLDKKCSEIDSLIAHKEKFIKELESYKKSLIYEYVTGKKEVLNTI